MLCGPEGGSEAKEEVLSVYIHLLHGLDRYPPYRLHTLWDIQYRILPHGQLILGIAVE